MTYGDMAPTPNTIGDLSAMPNEVWPTQWQPDMSLDERIWLVRGANDKGWNELPSEHSGRLSGN